MKHSRTQWKEKAKQRGKGERYERREKARMKAERDRLTHALKASEARVHALEAPRNGLATRPKVDVVYLALQLFLEARISFRAVSRANHVIIPFTNLGSEPDLLSRLARVQSRTLHAAQFVVYVSVIR